MLELHVANNDVTSGSISVGWCVSVDTLKFLDDAGYKNPVVVLCTAPSVPSKYNNSKEFRKVVPLKDLVGYVEFLSAGENNIWGFIAAGEKVAKGKFLEKHHNSYYNDVLDSDGTSWRYNKECLSVGDKFLSRQEMDQLLSEPVKVFVPAECFAPEPPEWEKAWVNHFLSSKVIDQCAFRRRRLFAYTVQPVIMLFNLFWRLVALLWASLFGLRGWSMQPLLHPLTYSMIDATNVGDISEGTYFVGRGENVYLNYAPLPFMPIFLPIYYFIWKSHAVLGVSLVLLICAVAVLMGFATYFLRNWYHDYSIRAEKNSKAWYMDEEEMNYILCSANGTKATSLKQLPFAKRTLRLRFQDLKTKVCRPFSA